MFAVHFDPPAFPGEVWISCDDEAQVRAVVLSLKKIDVEVTDVERDGESLLAGEFGKIMTG